MTKKTTEKRNININKSILLAAAVTALSLCLTACGAKSAATADMMVAETAAAMEMPAAGMAGGMKLEAQSAPMEMADVYNGEITEEEFGGALNDYDLRKEKLENSGNVPTERKLIKNVYLELETREYEKTVSDILAEIEKKGGYIESSNEYHPGINDRYSKRNINLTARIPEEKLDEFTGIIENNANVTYRSENVTDVTLQYTDTESRKKSLEAERDRLMELMKEAESVDAVIAIEARLSEIRYEIESRESQLRVYDNQADYSTVSIFINEVEVYSPDIKQSAGERIVSGLKQNIKDIGRFFENGAIAVISHLPAIILIAAGIILIIVIIRKIITGRTGKKNSTESGE